MTLIDTSAWIRHLRAANPVVRRLLNDDAVVGHDFVYGELLIGDRGGRHSFLRDYALLPTLAQVPHTDVVRFAQTAQLTGRGLSWIDVHLLAAALVARVTVLTADRRLAEAASALGVGYRP
jgi:hypothetical protein